MKKSKETYFGKSKLVGLKESEINKMDLPDLRAVIRTSNQILKSANKARAEAGLPLLDIPTTNTKGMQRSQVVRLALSIRRKAVGKNATVTGFKKMAQKAIEESFKKATGYTGTATMKKEGILIDGVLLPYKDIGKFFKAFNALKDKYGYGRGTQGSADVLTEVFDVYKGTSSMSDFIKSVRKRAEDILKEKDMEETALKREEEPPEFISYT